MPLFIQGSSWAGFLGRFNPGKVKFPGSFHAECCIELGFSVRQGKNTQNILILTKHLPQKSAQEGKPSCTDSCQENTTGFTCLQTLEQQEQAVLTPLVFQGILPELPTRGVGKLLPEVS